MTPKDLAEILIDIYATRGICEEELVYLINNYKKEDKEDYVVNANNSYYENYK